METGKETINERNIYGPFEGIAKTAQGLKAIICQHPYWSMLSDVEKESLDLICTKIARWLESADEDVVKDSILDISGYAELVIRDMTKREDDQCTMKI